MSDGTLIYRKAPLNAMSASLLGNENHRGAHELTRDLPSSHYLVEILQRSINIKSSSVFSNPTLYIGRYHKIQILLCLKYLPVKFLSIPRK